MHNLTTNIIVRYVGYIRMVGTFFLGKLELNIFSTKKSNENRVILMDVQINM